MNKTNWRVDRAIRYVPRPGSTHGYAVRRAFDAFAAAFLICAIAWFGGQTVAAALAFIVEVISGPR